MNILKVLLSFMILELMENGVNLLCKIVARAVEASRAAANLLKNLEEDEFDIYGASKDTVESKSLNTIVDHLSANFPDIKFKSKKNVGLLKFSLMIFIQFF